MAEVLDFSVISRLNQLNDGQSGDIVLQLIGIFFETTPKRLLQLEDSVARTDFNETFQIAHAMKSSCASLGLLEMTAQATRIEAAAKTKDPAIAELIPGIFESWKRASVELLCLAEERKS